MKRDYLSYKIHINAVYWLYVGYSHVQGMLILIINLIIFLQIIWSSQYTRFKNLHIWNLNKAPQCCQLYISHLCIQLRTRHRLHRMLQVFNCFQQHVSLLVNLLFQCCSSDLIFLWKKRGGERSDEWQKKLGGKKTYEGWWKEFTQVLKMEAQRLMQLSVSYFFFNTLCFSVTL